MYTYETRLGISQTDTNGLQTVVSAIDMMQDCSHFWMESEPEFMSFLKQNNTIMILAFRQLDIFRLAEYGERLTVKTSIYECNSYFGYRNTTIYGSDGTAYAKSWGQGAFLSLSEGRPAKLPAAVANAITYDEKADMDYLPKKIRLPEAAFTQLPSIKPTPFDIDFNQHVNNARYVQMACECLPSYREYNRLRIEYRKTATQQDEITPFIYNGDNVAYVKLCTRNAEPYCTIEFSKFSVE
ncbi:hypothetical protein LJC56_00450 [Christensenellaceae bacterium OttesenSCG-928-K19]|nr:hypothetical protein [Christensenellaceae bacterium OttesenSCG-928-K19]